jgi:hypothetical protein
MPSPQNIEELRQRIASGWCADYALFLVREGRK